MVLLPLPLLRRSVHVACGRFFLFSVVVNYEESRVKGTWHGWGLVARGVATVGLIHGVAEVARRS